MSNLELHFLKPGMLSTVQDSGRIGYQGFGVPVAGVMDQNAAGMANWLVGNFPQAPLLEMTLVGPTIELRGQGQIALSGADMGATLNGRVLPLGETIDIQDTSLLELGASLWGCRGYLAVGGGWQLTKWLHSFSASPQQGEVLTPQSMIGKDRVIKVENTRLISTRRISPKREGEGDGSTIRVIAGPEYNQMPILSIKDFLSRSFPIGPQSNRMGYRLKGSLLGYEPKEEVISSGIIPGTIQVTRDGQLIVLMKDAQSTGGYPRIANVISVDIGKVAQMRPGQEISFSLVSMAVAQRILSESKFY